MTSTREIQLSAGTIRLREAGQGPPIVFVHGLLTDGRLWRKPIAALEGRFRCIAPDLPLGAHATPMRAGADLSPRGVARLIAELLEALELDDVTLVANDTGGALAQLMVAERPERVGRLVLTPCDAFDNFLPPMFRPLQVAAKLPGGLSAALQPLRLRAVRRLPFAFGWLSKRPLPPDLSDDWLRPFFTDRGVRRDLTRFVRAIDAGDTQDAAARLHRFARPVLIAWAPEDRFFPWGHAERLRDIFPDARLESVESSRTFVSQDQPERLADLVGEFAGSAAEPAAAGG